MLMLKHNWFYPVILAIVVILNLTACADYPSDPRAPKSDDDNYTTKEDTFLNVPVEKGVLTNDQAKEGATLFLDTVGAIETQNGGTVNMAEDGSFSYEPPADFNGDDQGTYLVHNSKGKSDESTIFIKVTPVNDPPKPQDDQIETPIDQEVTIDALSNDVEPDGDTMAIQKVGAPDSGSVRVNVDGTLAYAPQAGHAGAVSFEYVVSDEKGGKGKAWVYINIGNTGLRNDRITVAEGQSITFPADDLLANDENGARLTVTSVGDAQNGTAVLQGDAVTYTPNPHYSGPDRFTYTAESAGGTLASALVNVTVTPIQDVPTISDISDQIIPMGGNTGAIAFRINDPDTPLNRLQVTARVDSAIPENLLADPRNPHVGIFLTSSNSNALGPGPATIRVVPRPNMLGAANITVTVTDPDENQASDSFVLTVGADGSPTISDIPDQQIDQGQSTGWLPFECSDPNTPLGNLRVVAEVTDSNPRNLIPSNGIRLSRVAGAIQVTPNPNLFGTATIRVTVRDRQGNQAFETFVVTVNPASTNTPPTISPASVPNQDWNIGGSYYLDFTIDDRETSPEDLNFSVDSSSLLVVDGSYYPIAVDRLVMRVELQALFPGSSQITVQVADQGGLSARVVFEVHVGLFLGLSQNSAKSKSPLSTGRNLNGALGASPLLQNDIYSADVNQKLTIKAGRGVLANDRDIFDQALSVTPFSNSCLTLKADGSFTYTPTKRCFNDKPPANDRQSFAYTVFNGRKSAKSTMTIVISGNQVPRVVTDGYVANGQKRLNITAAKGLLINDTDPDEQPLVIVNTGVHQTLFGGEVTIQADGSFRYISPLNFDGFDSFAYTVTDGEDSALGLAEISVTP
jgi:hypothetical protein